MRQHPARVAGKVVEKGVLGGREADLLAADAHHAAGIVDAQVARLEHLTDGGELALIAAEDGADAGQELQVAERLGDVVVGAHLQAAHLVHLSGAGGKHDDGNVGKAPDLLAQLEAIDIGKHDVEQDEVRLLLLDEAQPCLAVGGRDDLGLGPAQVEAEVHHLDDVGFVVDDQYLHLSPLSSKAGHEAALNNKEECAPRVVTRYDTFGRS